MQSHDDPQTTDAAPESLDLTRCCNCGRLAIEVGRAGGALVMLRSPTDAYPLCVGCIGPDAAREAAPVLAQAALELLAWYARRRGPDGKLRLRFDGPPEASHAPDDEDSL